MATGRLPRVASLLLLLAIVCRVHAASNDEPQDYEGWQKFNGAMVYGYWTRHVKAYNRTSCIEACALETQFRCLAVSYEHRNTNCYLSKNTRSTVPPANWKENSASWVYYERKLDPVDTNNWMEFPEKVIYGYDNRIVDTQTKEACLQACEQEKTFYCRSVDWDSGSSKKCYMSKDTKDTVANGYFKTYPAGWIHYQRKDPVIDKNDWLEIEGQGISGYDDRVIYSQTFQACAAACLLETSFNCLSFDWDSKASKKCFLSRNTKDTVPTVSFTKFASFIYYERKVPKADLNKWQLTKDYVIWGYDNRVVDTQTVEACLVACQEQKKFHCLSVDWDEKTKKCYLSKNWRYTVPVASWSYQPSSSWVHYDLHPSEMAAAAGFSKKAEPVTTPAPEPTTTPAPKPTTTRAPKPTTTPAPKPTTTRTPKPTTTPAPKPTTTPAPNAPGGCNDVGGPAVNLNTPPQSNLQIFTGQKVGCHGKLKGWQFYAVKPGTFYACIFMLHPDEKNLMALFKKYRLNATKVGKQNVTLAEADVLDPDDVIGIMYDSASQEAIIPVERSTSGKQQSQGVSVQLVDMATLQKYAADIQEMVTFPAPQSNGTTGIPALKPIINYA